MNPISMVAQAYKAAVFLQTVAGKAKTNEKQCLELKERVDTIISLLKIRSTDLERPHLGQPLNNLHCCIEQCIELANKCQEAMPWYWKLFSDSSYTQQFESLNGKLSHYINDLQFGINSRSSFDLEQDEQDDVVRTNEPVETQNFVKEEYPFVQIPNNDLVQEQLIGRGGFADVYRGKWRSQEVAIKILRIEHLDAEAKKEFMNEVSTMCNIHYDHILKIFGGCMETERYALVVEYMSLGSLYDVLRKRKIELTWSDRWSIARQMIQGINYLHSLSKPIIHRDIKSLNILMTEHDHELIVKISDFGLARILQRPLSGSSCNVTVGSLAWKAPEILRMEKHTEASDIYALGIVLWELATGQVPYEGHDESTISVFVRGGDRLEISKNIPPSFAKLISSAWAHEPKQRPTCEHLLDLLKDNSDDSTLLTYTQVAQEVSKACSDESQTLVNSNTSASSSLYSLGQRTSNFSEESTIGRLRRYSSQKKKRMSIVSLSAGTLIDIWRRFDEDGNGFINGENVEKFLGEVAKSIGHTLESMLLQNPTLKALVDRCLDEENVKIGLEDFTGLLPVEDKFLLLFRKNNPLQSTVDFIRIWKKFDYDRSGYIEASELSALIRELKSNKLKGSENTNQEITDEELTEYSALILRVFDSNGDGLLQLSEMIKLTQVKTHSLLRHIRKQGSFTSQDIDHYFDSYDQDKDGLLKEEEFEGFVYDVLGLSEKEIDFHMLEELKQILIENFAATEGQLTKTEVCEIMTTLCRKEKEIPNN